MFARNVAIRLKPHALNQFREAFEAQVVPLLRKHAGFRDVITFAITGGTDIVAISLWETREQAEAYHSLGFPVAMKCLEPMLDGNPKLRVFDIVSSSFHQTVGGMAA